MSFCLALFTTHYLAIEFFLFIYWSIQGTPGAPGAPGNTGPPGKQGELGPPVSVSVSGLLQCSFVSSLTKLGFPSPLWHKLLHVNTADIQEVAGCFVSHSFSWEVIRGSLTASCPFWRAKSSCDTYWYEEQSALHYSVCLLHAEMNSGSAFSHYRSITDALM